MKSVITNPWTIITLCLVLPVTAYSVMKWYDAYYKVPASYGVVKQTSLDGFTNQRNEPAGNLLKTDLTVVNFFFTSCPVVCPKMMKNMQSVHEHFSNDSSISYLSISVDPERDNQQRLQAFIKKMHLDDKGWQFIHGGKSATYILARNQFKLVAADASDNNDFIHSDKLMLIDRSGNIRGYYSGLDRSDIDQLIIDIKKLKS